MLSLCGHACSVLTRKLHNYQTRYTFLNISTLIIPLAVFQLAVFLISRITIIAQFKKKTFQRHLHVP